MPGRPKSIAQKRQEQGVAYDRLMSRAVKAYKEELSKPLTAKRKSLRTICDHYEQLYLVETGVHVKLCHVKLYRLVHGGHTIREANAAKGWLTKGEVDTVINYIIECGNRGFPLSHRRLQAHVNQILRARLGDEFWEEGVGKNWTHRFAMKHRDQIKLSWATSLEEKRGQGANPHANTDWWKLLGDTITKYDIKQENIYGTDEVGIQPQTGERERVFGSSKKKGPQHQQQAGTRENITTICADGTSSPPAVIFKGSAFQVKWAQNNPLNALLSLSSSLSSQFLNYRCYRIRYQKKGWTDGEIGAEWMKIFDEQTKEKANGAPRLLLVDGHNSHYTLEFLQHARMNNIIVLCYPAHTTHIYQGLDVVIFAVLKRVLSEERDIWLREKGKTIDKTNFLEIYARAHLRALTKANILAVFRKTGVHPYNPDVITPDMLAPSKETSIEGQLPLPPPTPLRTIAHLLQKISDNNADDVSEDGSDTPPSPSLASGRSASAATHAAPTGGAPTRQAFQDAAGQLAQTDISYLLEKLTITSQSTAPPTPTGTIHFPPLPFNLTSIIPQTDNERLLVPAL